MIDREQIGKMLRDTYVRVLEEPLPKRIANALRDLRRKP